MGSLTIAEQAAAPDDPPAGEHVIYPMDDGTLRAKSSVGDEHTLGQLVAQSMGNMVVPDGFTWLVPSEVGMTSLTVNGTGRVTVC